MLLSLLMPAYNEAGTVEEAIRRVRSVPLQIELICIDDGSTDGTPDILRRLHEEGAVDTLLLHRRNHGKGAALRSGIEVATGEIVAVQDADLEYDPHELPRLLEPILDGKADAVFGSRFMGGPHRVLYFWHRVGNGVVTLASNMLTNLNLTDMETGYKVIRTELLRTLPLTSDRFGFEPEITARLAQSGARIYETSISYSGRTYGEGKKIGWKDGVAALWHIVRCNLRRPSRGRPAPAYDLLESGGARAPGGEAPAHRIGARSGGR
jgi:glycosyltransferase involved in cell wall biosynthesis